MSALARWLLARGAAPIIATLFVLFVLGFTARTALNAQTSSTKSLQPFQHDDDPDETPTPKKKATPAAKKSPSPTKKSTRKKESSDDDASPAPKKKNSPTKKQATATATPKPKSSAEKPAAEATLHAKRTESADTAIPRAKAVASTTPVASPAPRVVASAAPSLPPADITVEKSGVEENQGYEPPPPPPPRRGFFARLFGARESANYRYLTNRVIDALRRAPVQRGRWKFIVVHNSGTRQGNAAAFDYYHRHVRRMQNGLAYHFVVGNGTSSGNGQIEIGDRWRRQINGGHVHSDYLNNISLGICLVGDFNRDQPTRAQLDASDELIRYLRERCGRADGREIPVRPHREMNPPQWATDCPGDAFPYSWFRRF